MIYRDSPRASSSAAAAGATLWVRGTCTGTTQISKNLTLTGQHPAGFTAPTLNGGGQGSVLILGSGITVTINTLTITGGNAGGGSGGIAITGGTLTLNGSSITGNTGSTGGGIYNAGTLTLNGSSSITGNKPDNCAPPGSVPACTG